ncbi:LysR family transcriptional regulator [Nocardioides insulae]|uniref:LysR family transcriptional regulator n=1 Tax=Nocardioides insulae TaxID=394734 RepID=UPI000429CB6D|nr:LysR family transcriptional regulator [Nocardioides insulae]
MDVRHLLLLRDLEERGSVTAVAEATHRTPSAVSQQLRGAARELGLPLVEAHGRGVRLTEAGRLLAHGGRDVARTLAEVTARWDAFRGHPAGQVSVACLPSAAAFLLPAVLRELSVAEPGLDLVCTDVDLAEDAYAALVLDHDLVIAHSLTRAAPAGTDGLVTRVLAREPLDIAMRRGHPLAARESLNPEDLVGWEWYGVPLGFPFDTVRLAVEEATDARIEVVQRIRDNRLVEALVADSDRLAVLPRFTTPPGSGVELRPLAAIPTARYVVAVLRPDKAERLAVRRVLAALVSAGASAEAGAGPG